MKEELFNKARNHDLNVEDIINISYSRNSDIAIVLQEIKDQFGWQNDVIEHDNGNIVPPMGMWVDVACIYIASGYEGLVIIGSKVKQVSFVVAFLQEYKTRESVISLIRIAEYYLDDPSTKNDALIKIASGINLLLSFKDAPEIESSISDRARKVIHKCLSYCKTSAEFATVIYALRGVGDNESIELISNIPKLQDEWLGTENVVKKAIRKRIKNL